MSKKAIVLLSGGMDSATALYWAKAQGYRCHCLVFDYGQRHKKEMSHAVAVAKQAGVAWTGIKIALPWKNGSSLLDAKQRLPNIALNKIGKTGIPSTYVPGRNTLFTAYAISAADALGAEAIILGPNVLDFSGYPDCRPEYYEAFRRVAHLGTRRGQEGKTLKILTPLIRFNKAQIVRLALRLQVPLDMTWSCYAGLKHPCRRCDSCKLRAKGFKEAGVSDPSLTARV